jgi:hypothetical protein
MLDKTRLTDGADGADADSLHFILLSLVVNFCKATLSRGCRFIKKLSVHICR